MIEAGTMVGYQQQLQASRCDWGRCNGGVAAVARGWAWLRWHKSMKCHMIWVLFWSVFQALSQYGHCLDVFFRYYPRVFIRECDMTCHTTWELFWSVFQVLSRGIDKGAWYDLLHNMSIVLKWFWSVFQVLSRGNDKRVWYDVYINVLQVVIKHSY